MTFISVNLLIVILTWLCCWLDFLRPSFVWRMSGGCRVHAGTPWQWLMKEGVSCSPASPWGTGFFFCCAWKGPLGAAEELWLFFSPYPLSAIFLNCLFLLGGWMTDLGAAQHSGCPWAAVSVALSNHRGEMDGSLTIEEAPKPICGSFCFASWKSLTALIPVLAGDFYVSTLEIFHFSDAHWHIIGLETLQWNLALFLCTNPGSF